MEETAVKNVDSVYTINRKSIIIDFRTALMNKIVNAYYIKEVVDEHGEYIFPMLIRNNIGAIEKALNMAYLGQWSYDIALNDETPFLRIIIHFPVVHITNGSRESHIIRDLYVRFNISQISNKLIIHRLDGARTTFTSSELTVGYRHSHLSSGDHIRNINMSTVSSRRGEISGNTYYSEFCLGQRSPGSVNWILDKLATGFDIKLFHMFLIQIKSYVAWESIAGVPYIHIRRITGARNESQRLVSFMNENELYDNIVKFIGNNKPAISLINRNIFTQYNIKDNGETKWFIDILKMKPVDLIDKIIQFDGSNFIVDVNTDYFTAFSFIIVTSLGNSFIGCMTRNFKYVNCVPSASKIDSDIDCGGSGVTFNGKLVRTKLLSNSDPVMSYPTAYPIIKHTIANMLKSVVTINSIFRMKVKRKIFIDLK